ncbi:MAG: rod shape-determining protein RodA [bacterium]|nr:rod shape-determining protein RodA [bacterium]
MLRRFLNILRAYDWILFGSVLFLVTIGVLLQYGLSLGQEGATLSFFWRQLVFAILGVLIVFIASVFDYRGLRTWTPWLYLGALGLLITVLIIGATLRGVKGWIPLFGFQFQVVELVKLLMVMVLAKYWIGKVYEVGRLKHIIASGILTAIPFTLILLQPDLGSGLIIFGLWLTIVLLTGIRLRYFLIMVLSGIIIAVGAWLFLFKDYQKQRILTFVYPTHDPLGSGYQVRQSVIAVGSGRFFGRGLGLGTQSQLHFLPETRTDFAFAVIAEELGFVGVTLLLGLYVVFFWRLYVLARHGDDDFSIFLVVGFFIIFFLQAFVNIGMNLGIAPIVGLPLPFISYGGSSLLCSLVAVGILESIAVRQRLEL